MITIDVITKAVSLDHDTPVMARNQFGNATYGYVRGWIKPNYQLPAIRYAFKYDYSDLRYGKVIGLMMGNMTKCWLEMYWPRD